MTEAETKVILAIASRTLGPNQPEEVRLTSSELAEAAGLKSRQAAAKGAEGAIQKGFILCREDPDDNRGICFYRVQLAPPADSSSQPVKQINTSAPRPVNQTNRTPVNQDNRLDETCYPNSHKPVKQINTTCYPNLQVFSDANMDREIRENRENTPPPSPSSTAANRRREAPPTGMLHKPQEIPNQEEEEALPSEWEAVSETLRTLHIFNGFRRPIIDRARFELGLSPDDFLVWAQSEFTNCGGHGGRLKHRLEKESPPPRRQAASDPETEFIPGVGTVRTS